MPDPTTKDVALAVVLERLSTIDDKLTASLAKIESHDATLYGEKNALGLVGHVSEIDRRLTGLESGLRWLGGILLTLVIGLVWGLITGAVTITR